MKKFGILLSVLFCLLIPVSYGSNSSIVAIVNDDPITLQDFNKRKQMIIGLNENSNLKDNNKMLTQLTLKSLIDDRIMIQHAKKIGASISDDEVDEAERSIERNNKMPSGQLTQLLLARGIDRQSFREQLRSELIKSRIFGYISKSVAVSSIEIDNAILANDTKDAKVTLKVFTSKNQDETSLYKMRKLQKDLKNCSNIPKSYSAFADMTEVDDKLSNLDLKMRTICKDLEKNQASSVFESENSFRVVIMCNKVIDNITDEENRYVVSVLTNKKTTQKAQKFIQALRKRSYIKIMM